MSQVKVIPGIYPRTYRVLRMAVEDGVRCGWSRAHKHVDDPETDAILEHIQDEVINQICEWFKFDDEIREDD